MDVKKHNISISEDVYTSLKDYCELNGKKVNVLAETFIKDGLAMEKFGDAPFITIVDNPSNPDIPIIDITDLEDDYWAVNGTEEESAPIEIPEIKVKEEKPTTVNNTPKKRRL